MAKQYAAKQVAERLKKERDVGWYIYSAGAGSGLSARACEAGGAHLITAYTQASFRMRGLPSAAAYLALGDANAFMLDFGEREILRVVKETPVCVGLLGVDPTRDMSRVLDEAKDVGFSGVLNFPTVGNHDMRRGLEETGIPFQKEIDFLQLAGKKDLFTQAFCPTFEDAQRMADVGVDLLVVHAGMPEGFVRGDKAAHLDAAAEFVGEVCEKIKQKYPDILILCHGGPISGREEFLSVAKKVPKLDGFMGGSAGESIPAEQAICEETKKCSALKRA